MTDKPKDGGPARWEILTIAYQGPGSREQGEIRTLLDLGWEPISVTGGLDSGGRALSWLHLRILSPLSARSGEEEEGER